MGSRSVALPDLWNKTKKHEYLDRLAKEGFSIKPIEVAGIAKGGGKPSPAGNKSSKKAGYDIRSTLIPKQLNFDSAASRPGLLKIWRVWDELQNRLYLSRNPCSIGVMLRCLIWMATDRYVDKRGIKGARQRLHDRMKDVAIHMEQAQFIDSDYAKVLKSFADSEGIISARATHLIVHSSDFVPSENHLRALWETLERYICICLDIKM